MGRKLPKKTGYKRDNSSPTFDVKFPNCIGKFPDCINYTSEMSLSDRPECERCPFNK